MRPSASRQRVIGFSLFAWVLWGLLCLRVYQELEPGPAKNWLSCGLDLNWDVDRGLLFLLRRNVSHLQFRFTNSRGGCGRRFSVFRVTSLVLTHLEMYLFFLLILLFPSLPWRASNLTCTRCIVVEQNRLCQSSRQQRTKQQHTATADGPF